MRSRVVVAVIAVAPLLPLRVMSTTSPSPGIPRRLESAECPPYCHPRPRPRPSPFPSPRPIAAGTGEAPLFSPVTAAPFLDPESPCRTPRRLARSTSPSRPLSRRRTSRTRTRRSSPRRRRESTPVSRHLARPPDLASTCRLALLRRSGSTPILAARRCALPRNSTPVHQGGWAAVSLIAAVPLHDLLSHPCLAP